MTGLSTRIKEWNQSNLKSKISGMLKGNVEQVCTDYTMPAIVQACTFAARTNAVQNAKKPEIEKTAQPTKSKQFAHSDWWKMQPVLHASFSHE